MCIEVSMPDGEILRSFEGEDDCFCGVSQAKILGYAISKLHELQIGEKLVIERDVFGFDITIQPKC